MTTEKYNCYLVKKKDGTLIKFCYDSQQGIYYQIFMKQNWSEKISIYKESFEYFYVLEDWNERIHVFCQDICGDLILCTLEGTEWKYKILLHMKYDVIMPIHVRAFFHSDDIHLLYNILDKHTYSEVLVHQIARNGIQWSSPKIITQLDYYYRFPYDVSQDCESNLVLLNTMLAGMYQLTSRNFHIIEERWGKQEVIHTSLLPYIDFTFCFEENRKYYLFITQDDQVNRVICQYKEMGLQKNIILFQHKKIDSCLLILSNNILWALWICGDKLYGCFSTNYGENFSSPRVYNHFDNGLPIKVFYQEYSANKQNKYTSHEIYVMNINGEEQFFSQELLENLVVAQVDHNEDLKANAENVDCEIEELKDYLTKVEILKREKEELQAKLKISEEELNRLNEARKYEKNQILKLQYQFYKEKEKFKSCTNDKDILKEKNSYLENKLLLKDKEKASIEKKLAEKEKENESLKQQIDIIRDQNLFNSEKSIKESINDSSKQARFSLIKWMFDD
ncbi:hypothetical protein CLPUN_49780 [Clostridium puniceum]|uniref:Uncharacterized protein n=1 Tax=Clostridium puniceum TaxID=29367 RepID=A0A1S8T118_9CLOT|nr:hypothetical protein [Clostridium puniceum]OOM71294.1 hypothetical protein CLPUN_49780 [Clostridium puniceum]